MRGADRWRAVLLILAFWPVITGACVPAIESIAAAPGVRMTDMTDATQARPTSGWVPVTLPDDWSQRWPDHDGAVWYRVHWRAGCNPPGQPPGQPPSLVVESLNSAGEIHINTDLLWRDASLTEPLSRSWNLPRHWMLPQSALVAGTNTLWFQVRGHALASPGLGRVHLLAQSEAHALTRSLHTGRRTMFVISLALSLITSGVFASLWLFYRRSAEHGWFALTCLAWSAFVWNMLATSTWPFPDVHALMRANTIAFLAYVACFRMFARRFATQGATGTDSQAKGLAVAGAAGAIALLLTPDAHLGRTIGFVSLLAALTFVWTCLAFIGGCLRARTTGQRLLAGLVALLLIAGVHDLLTVNGLFSTGVAFSPWAGLLLTMSIAAVLAIRIARNMRRVEHFNDELAAAVETACAELERALRQERELAISNSRLKERLRMSYDLHDGLGSALGRAIVLAEQGAPGTDAGETAHHLSTLRALRDELRQVIDAGEMPDAGAARTPIAWAAPTRHRFSALFDELGIRGHWQLAPQWHTLPSARQCLGLTRLMEEALTNVVKHSGADHVTVTLRLPDTDALVLCIEDDGAGFDVARTRASDVGIGLRSMQARADGMGARLEIASWPGCTRICLRLQLGEASI